MAWMVWEITEKCTTCNAHTASRIVLAPVAAGFHAPLDQMVRCPLCAASLHAHVTVRPATLDDLRPRAPTEQALMQALETCQPVRGYRWWRLERPHWASPHWVLVGIAYGQSWQDWLPRADGWAHAVCRCADGSTRFPGRSAAEHLEAGAAAFLYSFDAAGTAGTCGFYALAQAADLFCATEIPCMAAALFVCGEVDLAGVIVAHDRGYRASHARPVALYGPAPGVAWVFRSRAWCYPGPTSRREFRLFAAPCQVFAAPCQGLPTWPYPVPWPEEPQPFSRICLAGWSEE